MRTGQGISQCTLAAVPVPLHQEHCQQGTAEVSERAQRGTSGDVQRWYPGEGTKKRDEILRDYRYVAGEAMECLENGFGDSTTVMQLPKGLMCFCRTSNLIERKRIKREVKRRTKVIGVFPYEKSLVRLMGSVMMEHHAQNLAARKVFSDETSRSSPPARLRMPSEE